MSHLDILPFDLSNCLLGDYVKQARKNKQWKATHVAFTQNLGVRFMSVGVGGNGVAGHRIGAAWPFDFNLAWVVEWYADYSYVSERPVGGLDQQLWLEIGNGGIEGNNRWVDNAHGDFVKGFVRLCDLYVYS